MSLKKVSALVTALGLGLPAAAHAESLNTTDNSTDAQALDRVLVTATRTHNDMPTLAASMVLDRAAIERLQPRSLMDLLRGQAGINFSNNGGLGKVSSVFLRGTESRHVLVLVDGVQVGSATSGGAAWQDIPVEHIERIEVVRGPFSSLYGSEALGGVVQIFTRKPQAAGHSMQASVSAGSQGTWRGSAGINGKSEGDTDRYGGWYAVSVAHEQTDGINARTADAFGYDPVRDGDKDGYRNTSINARGGWRFSPEWLLEANVLQAESRSDYDGWPDSADNTQTVAGAKLQFDMLEMLRVRLQLGHNADLSENFSNAQLASEFNTRRDTVTVQVDQIFRENMLSIGWDWAHERVSGDTAYLHNSRHNRALFVQWQQTMDAHALQLSLRRDDNSQFGGKTTGSVIWGWQFADAYRMTASYGTAFRAPTFNHLYFPGFGNPFLRPEQSRSIELGVQGEYDWGNVAVNAFDTRVKDLIISDSSLTWISPWGGANNIDRARIRGIEASAETTLADWDMRLSVSWLDPRNAAGAANHDNLLPRRAQRSARIDVDRQFGAYQLGASLSAYSARFDDPGNTQRLGGYGLLDVRASRQLTDALSLAVSVNNITDKQYQTARTYNQLGRNWMLTLRYGL